ncbi:glycoside hydrolase family 19 protein [Erwiniaceae bacterium BAC15a-03b]|uniref:Glycoside hydrolase family 19 protein n=1 Tax=Winslowiella arboricola TaxID=2978220 RepID=A0A9J6Q1J6_9GAMM|nr:glycoside hydrolase family 19 protein [Winslowiella arboricola]MCU5774721.1 glycoside hydrolase family 19 protein [Winslowiella arboricola]MCU5780127.1 glycoside hydrolase family 19 protein [Winslowiella arboricola]
MDVNQFQQAANISVVMATRLFPYFVESMELSDIATPLDKAMFIAQTGHESNGFMATTENFNYSVETLQELFVPYRISRAQAQALGRRQGEPALPLIRQKAIANLVYQGRLGNSAVGDGWKYRGRGYLQITFRDNYRACGNALKLDLVANPEILEQEREAVRSAAWFWQSKGCSRYQGNIVRVTRIINGGQHGLAERKARFERACAVLR